MNKAPLLTRSQLSKRKSPLMILGTTSGAGKSLISAAICRILRRKGEIPIPFKGQNMSNNAWVDSLGGEMAYSQAMQSWAARIEPRCAMNPILLKPKGDCTSEVIHLGKSVGISNAHSYYEEWLDTGWEAILSGLAELRNLYKEGKFIIEGAGSPVEVNLQHKDLTNLKLAKHLNARCILVADIERGGVFAQIIGTLELLSSEEKKLIKGIIINKFRGDYSLFEDGKDWLERRTGIPILGVMPWLNETFPPEDTLDLINRRVNKKNAEVTIGIIKLPSLSNYSDIDPLESETTVNVEWISPGDSIREVDAIIVPGSKQTIKDLNVLIDSGLGIQIKNYAKEGGYLLGICGGMQILGNKLADPLKIESRQQAQLDSINVGLNILPIDSIFEKDKQVSQRKIISNWPVETKVEGFEIHHGVSIRERRTDSKLEHLFKEEGIGWVLNVNEERRIAGTYLHGILDNSRWRRSWINEIRLSKKLKKLPINIDNHKKEKDNILDNLADAFDKHINLDAMLID